MPASRRPRARARRTAGQIGLRRCVPAGRAGPGRRGPKSARREARHSRTLRSSTQRAGAAGGEVHDPQAQQALLGVKPTVPTVSTAQHEEDQQRPVARRLPIAAVIEPVRDQGAQGPVDGQRAEPPAGAGDRGRSLLRQTEHAHRGARDRRRPLPRPRGAGEPRSDCLPVVHPNTVLRPVYVPGTAGCGPRSGLGWGGSRC